MARTERPKIEVNYEKPANAAVEVLEGGVQVFVPVTGNVEAERKRVTKELEEVRGQLAKTEKQLNNPAFLEKAKPQVVEQQKGRREEFLERIAKLEQHLEDL